MFSLCGAPHMQGSHCPDTALEQEAGVWTGTALVCNRQHNHYIRILYFKVYGSIQNLECKAKILIQIFVLCFKFGNQNFNLFLYNFNFLLKELKKLMVSSIHKNVVNIGVRIKYCVIPITLESSGDALFLQKANLRYSRNSHADQIGNCPAYC